MFRQTTLATIILALFCALAIGLAATPASASATKIDQAQKLCQANKKCTDKALGNGPGADHVLCVKGGGCVYCEGNTGNCYASPAAGGVAIVGADPATLLMGAAAPPKPKLGAFAAANTGAGGLKMSGGLSSSPPTPTKPVVPTAPGGGLHIGH